MVRKKQFRITEWDWFKVQLRLRLLEGNGKWFTTRYVFRGARSTALEKHFPQADIQCMFWCKTTDDLIRKKAARSEHFEYYDTWVASEKARLRETLREFPTLKKQVDLRKSVVFTVLHGYGMGSAVVCHFHNDKVHWEKSTDSVPE